MATGGANGLVPAFFAPRARICACQFMRCGGIVFDRVDGDGRREWIGSGFLCAARQDLRVPVHAMRRHRQFILLWRVRSAFASQTKFAFDCSVVRAEIVVPNWPIGADAFGGMRFEIVAMKARHDAEPRERPAADAEPGLWNHRILSRINARFVPHNFRAVAFAIAEVHGWIEAFARFENGDGKPGSSKVMRDKRAARTGTNYNDVCGFTHWRLGKNGEHETLLQIETRWSGLDRGAPPLFLWCIW